MIDFRKPVVWIPGVLGIATLVYGVIQAVWTFAFLGLVIAFLGAVYSVLIGKETSWTKETEATPDSPEPAAEPETETTPDQPTEIEISDDESVKENDHQPQI